MGEVTSAVIATSLVLIAVFVPVSFFPGTTGILYRQFSLTIAFAIAISAFNALTLSPALVGHVPARRRRSPQAVGLPAHSPISRAFAAFIHGADAAVSAGWEHLRQGPFMSRCGCATCCCLSSSPAWAPRCGSTSTFPPASFPRKIRAS
jgi:multidrug efflux pump subunit AcrB